MPSLFDRFGGNGAKTPTDAQQQPAEPGTLFDRFAGPRGGGMGVAPTAPQSPALPQAPLPVGAKGLDPYGEPYFGAGISGILKKWHYDYTKDVKPVSDDDWIDLRDRWKELQNTSVEEVGGTERLQFLGEAASKLWQAGTAQGSLLSPVLKATSASVGAIGELFSIGAKKVEQTLGAAQGFKEAANELESPLPRLDGWADNAVHAIPIIGAAWDVSRVALSPSENKWDKAGKAIEEGWQAGRIFYSQILDHTLKEQFLQEYREGKDPELLAMKLQNPLAELVGQAILDPFWLVGAFGKASKTAKELYSAVKAETESGMLATELGQAAWKAIDAATDDQSAIRAWDEVVKAQTEVVNKITKESKLLNVGYSTDSLTTTSRQNAIVTKGKQLLGNMALTLKEQGKSYDAIAEAVLAGVRSVSENADEVRRGLADLRRLPGANRWIGDDYVESFIVLRNMMADADGVISGGKLRNLMKIKSPAQFAEEATKLYLSAAKGEFKDVSDMAKAYKTVKQMEKTGGIVAKETIALAQKYEELPNIVKHADRINELLKGATSPINKVLFPTYFNLQGGVAVRNIVTNNELIFLDKGPSAWFKDGKYWTLDNVKSYITDLYGALPESAHGFKSLVSSMTDRPAWGFGKLMEAGEEGGAVRIVGASIRDTFKTMLPKAMPNLSKHIESGALTDRQSRMLYSLVEKHNYNVDKAIEEFRNIYKIGSVEDWRNLDYVTDFQKDALQGFDLWRDIQDLAHRGAVSQDEVNAVFEKLNKVIDARAAEAVKDTIGISPDHPAIEAWGDLMRAAEEGHLDPDKQQVFTALMEAAEQARLDYMDLLDDVANKALHALNTSGRAQESFALGQEMNRVRSTIRKFGPTIKKEAHEITQDAWRWANEVKPLKKPTPEVLAEYWSKAGLEGPAPLDLDKKTLLQAIFDHRFNKVSELWNSSFDAVVGESETVLKQMESIIDTTELQAMASRTRFSTQRAQVYRNVVHRNGALQLIPKKDMAFVAKQYGVTVEEIINTINNKQGTAYKTIDEIPTQDIMNVIKQARDEKGLTTTVGRAKETGQAAKQVSMSSAAKTPVHELPPTLQERFEQTARRLLDELHGGEAGGVSVPKQGTGGEATRFGTSNVQWYRDLPESLQNKKAIDKALQKIIEDHGKDKGVNVERLKEFILDRFKFGDPDTGTPPDLYALQQLGADEKTLQTALDNWNDITRQEATLEEAIQATTPTEELLHSANQPYFDEAGNLIEPATINVPPPHPMGTEPSAARTWNESARDLKYILDSIQNEIVGRWGKTNAERTYSPAMEQVLSEVSSTLKPRVSEIKAIALRVAEKQRNFTLLNYGERTYGDIAKAYVLPFHFFYSRSYKNWIYRIATSPEIVSHYGQYREFLETENANLPDWYKQQLNVNPFSWGRDEQGLQDQTFLGIPVHHPLYMNLEATFNPLIGLTGVDYNDPVKRNNWFTATVDDMGKFGPTIYAPIQLGIAAALFQQGETDVAARWGTRVFPETAQIKALTNTLFGQPVELDPAVNFFSGGIDVQERNRMAYSAAQLIQSGQFTPEQIMLDFQAQQGTAWDAAYHMAIQSRAASSFSSWLLGVGFKPRSTNDVMVEQMYTDLNRLYAAADMMEPEKYRMAWSQLRSQYPEGFVDTVLLSRKGGDKRDAALAYEVLNRIPPGDMSAALKTIGLSQQEIKKFYDSKGFTNKDVKYLPQEKGRFMSAVLDMAAMLKIPDNATSKEWNAARTTYSVVYKQIEESLGDKKIWDKISHYYDLKDDNREAAQQFAQLHPEIFQAMQMKREAVLSTPVLAAYYGSIETIEAYLDGKLRQQLSDKYGPDIYDVQTGYYDSANPRGYLAQHPELKRFWNEKRVLESQNEKMFYQFANKLPTGTGAQFQEGFAPQSYTQEQLYKSLQPEDQMPSWEEVSVGMPQWLQAEIANYAQNNRPLSKRANKEMDYLAKQGNYYNSKELLRMAVLAMQQPLAQPAGAGGGLFARFGGQGQP